MKLVKRFVRLFLFFLWAILLLSFPQQVGNGIRLGLTSCGSVLIPSLFPFMVLSNLAVYSRIGKDLARFLEPISRKWFRLPSRCAVALFMGMIGGYPVGAQIVSEMLDRGEINRNTAERLLCLCVNAGPSFLIAAVGSSMLGNLKSGVLLLSAQVCSVLILGCVLGRIDPVDDRSSVSHISNTYPLGDALVMSVSKAITGMLSLCGYVLLFSMVLSLTEQLPFDLFYLTSLFEVTSGCLAAVNRHASLPFLGFLTSFGGFSVHFQVFSFFHKQRPSTVRFLISRILYGGLTASLVKVGLSLFPRAVSVSAVNRYTAQIPASPLFSVLLMVLCAVFLLSFPESIWRRLD